MKNLINFKTEGLIPLKNSELKMISGGGSFSCYCGHVGGQWQGSTFTVSAGGIIAALNSAGSQCGGLGATCSGGQK